MIYILALILSLSFTQASQRYIIQYDDAAWNNFQLMSVPSETVYILKNLKMIVADLSSSEIMTFEAIPGVTVHEDQEMHIFDVQENPKNWGLDRIDQHGLPLDNKYHFGTQGEGVDVYIIDTGVTADHQEFEGRAALEQNFAGDKINKDCNGHGTHVSSTIAGKTVGVAKKAKVHGVKVLNCAGAGSNSGVIAGIDYVVGQHKKNPGQKSVINMSLGGGKSDAVNAAAEAAYQAGIVFVVAAGNSNADACNVSPASAPNAITVAASDKNDKSATFTNWGKCVDIYAPGVNIYAAFGGFFRKNAYKSLSGTSMASPHTAGVAALVLSSGQATTPDEVKAKLTSGGSKNVLKGVPKDTPQILLYADPSWTTA